ncbi:Uncharacterized protein GBIM_13734 [Gryllus bimaculatus]|nr:Uncharacterized protein GBIM_13734 [Gryllus bimaculatus]
MAGRALRFGMLVHALVVAALAAAAAAGDDGTRANATASPLSQEVLDSIASGRYSRRLHTGNGFWLGSRELCRQLDEAAAAGGAGDAPPPPFRFSYHVAKMDIDHDLLPEARSVALGLCMPAACSAGDTQAALVALGAEPGRNVVSSGIITSLVIIATLYDFFLLNCTKTSLQNSSNNFSEENNNITVETQHFNGNNYKPNTFDCMDDTHFKVHPSSLKYSRTFNGISNIATKNNEKEVHKARKTWKWRDDVSDNIFMQMLLSFSLRTNLQKLCSLKSGDDTLTPIHGLRVITLMWIVLVHACLMTFQNADNKLLKMKAEQDFLFQTLSSGTYSVDTFFVISGTLVSFLYFRTISKISMKELTFTDGYKAGIMQFLGMTGYRFMRLTPTYLYVLGIITVCAKYYQDHAVMELPTKDHDNCEKYWWRNMLYINTFYTAKERCMSWSWYLANDTQFYTIGTVAVALVGLILLSAWTTSAILTINTQHRPSIEDPFANYEDLYDKPWIRVGPYFIGMCAGWILCKTNCEIKLHKGWLILCWILAFSIMCSVVYGLYGVEFGPVLSAMYVALGHSAWALAIAWILIACSTGNGGIVDKILSWPYLYPISRLTYCTYLIHPQVIRIVLLNYDSSFHITIDMMGTVYVGFLIASYIAALFISLTFEAPMTYFIHEYQYEIIMFKNVQEIYYILSPMATQQRTIQMFLEQY